MTIPPTAIEWGKPMDPSAVKDWGMDLSGRLEADETIESFDLDLSAEGVAAGVAISTGDGRDPSLINDGKAIRLWFEVDPADQADPMWNDAGTRIGVQVTFVTNSIPSRTDQLTYVLRIAQQ